jgi:cold shock CspA family protein
MGRIQKTSPTFDFIQTNDGRRFFAHWTNFIDIASAKELERILGGQWVEFTPTSNSKGPIAINIRIQD